MMKSEFEQELIVPDTLYPETSTPQKVKQEKPPHKNNKSDSLLISLVLLATIVVCILVGAFMIWRMDFTTLSIPWLPRPTISFIIKVTNQPTHKIMFAMMFPSSSAHSGKKQNWRFWKYTMWSIPLERLLIRKKDG